MDHKEPKSLAIMIGMKPHEKDNEDGGDITLEDLAKDLCQGIEDKDYGAIATAFEAMFTKLESTDHEEGEADHSESEDKEE